MTNVAILDDEEKFRTELKSALADIFANIHEEVNIFEFSDSVAFLEGYKANYDIIFMDICMPYMDGIEAAKRLRQADPDTMLIFITGMASYSINGYDVGAFDFILKPLDYANLNLKVGRAISEMRRKQKQGLKIVAGGADNFDVLNSNDILYIEVFAHDVIYHTTHGEYRGRESLKKLGDSLKPLNFVYAHRCYLVNLKYVKSVNDDTVTCGADTLKIGRTYKKSLIKAITDYYTSGNA